MNNSNPFIPQGSLLEQKNKKRARVKLAVYSIFAMNILVISPLLIQGCSKKETPPADQPPLAAADTNAPDTNVATQLPPPPPPTNLTVAQSNTPPPPPPAPVVPETPATREYVVAKNDSFYTIAKKFGVKMKEVEAANPNIPPTKLKVGMKLQIPGSENSAPASGGATAVPDASDSIYVVKAGDSLTKIAKSNGVTLKALRSENELKTDKIKVGQKLKLPAKMATVETPAAPASVPANPAAQPAPSAPANGAMQGR